MLTRKLGWWAAAIAAGLGIGAAMTTDYLLAAGTDAAKQDLKPAVSLPITRVVLFNSGVGYFSRSGEVVDDARVDLMFPEQDVNDLLKSMVLEDLDRGRIAAVSYDSREPIARTLSSFAVNLNGNPTFAGILGQMRGDRVEVVVSPGAANQPGKLSGAIVGVEMQKVAHGSATMDAEVLTMWCAEGLRSVRVQDIQQLKFANPLIESEFRRALDVLAMGHDSQKKAVSVHFAGEGKRRVQVGYVVEAPIWKTSYRLVLADKEKPYLQGWAMVENQTDEDWAGVKMALISGRPISFKMDLYNPLYVGRPVVEPELFASLRPVTYRGGMEGNKRGSVQFTMGEFGANAMPGPVPPIPPMGGYPGGISSGVKPQIGTQYRSPGSSNPIPARGFYDSTGVVPDPNLADTFLSSPAPLRTPTLSPGLPAPNFAADVAKEMNKAAQLQSIGSAATAASLGDFFQYTIDHPVSLARQKSALLPIVGKAIEGQRMSIYNQAVQAKHPLLGLKFKNTTDLHLNQGPITVFEGSVYAGDTRVLDVQPGEERLVSYAIDLGMEVDPQTGSGTQKITSVKSVKGVVTTKTRLVEEKTYRIINRGQTDRTLVIEHPNRTNQGFKLADMEKPMEDTPDVYRFQVAVKTGETKTFKVKEQVDGTTSITLTNNSDGHIRYLLNLTEISPSLKKQLTEAMALQAAWQSVQRESQQVAADLNVLQLDQDRIRKNLRETPKEAEVYGTYLKKLSTQEKEIDVLTARQKKIAADEFAARKKYEEFLAQVSD